jgi:hypothetical protein
MFEIKSVTPPQPSPATEGSPFFGASRGGSEKPWVTPQSRGNLLVARLLTGGAQRQQFFAQLKLKPALDRLLKNRAGQLIGQALLI